MSKILQKIHYWWTHQHTHEWVDMIGDADTISFTCSICGLRRVYSLSWSHHKWNTKYYVTDKYREWSK